MRRLLSDEVIFGFLVTWAFTPSIYFDSLSKFACRVGLEFLVGSGGIEELILDVLVLQRCVEDGSEDVRVDAAGYGSLGVRCSWGGQH